MSGKGDKRRPTKVDDDTFSSNWDKVFGPKTVEVQACPYCDSEVTTITMDYIDYCPECELVVEGHTVTKEIEE